MSLDERNNTEGRGEMRYGPGGKSGMQTNINGNGNGSACVGVGAGRAVAARRIPVGTQQGYSRGSAAPPGLKAPVGYGGAGSGVVGGAGGGVGVGGTGVGGAGGAALPRPVSRLPAPSGPGRVRMVGKEGNNIGRRVGGYGL